MPKISGSLLALALFLVLSIALIPVGPASGQPVQPAGDESGNSIQYHGYEAVIGVTSRAQALLVFEGSGDKKLAVMTGNFVPTLQIFVNTPFRPFKIEEAGEEKTTRTGYYWKYSYNKFSLDRQEDPDTEGIGPSSPVLFPLHNGPSSLGIVHVRLPAGYQRHQIETLFLQSVLRFSRHRVQGNFLDRQKCQSMNFSISS